MFADFSQFSKLKSHTYFFILLIVIVVIVIVIIIVIVVGRIISIFNPLLISRLSGLLYILFRIIRAICKTVFISPYIVVIFITLCAIMLRFIFVAMFSNVKMMAMGRWME